MNKKKLKIYKIVHTIIWYFYVCVFSYIFIDLIFDLFTIFLWICIGLVFLEGFILLLYGWRCPITVKAEKETTEREVGFDIYLPKWLAKYNKIIFTFIFIFQLLFLLYRLLT